MKSRLIIAAVLAAVVLLAVAAPAPASTPTVVSSDAQWAPWAMYWERQAQHNRVELLIAGRAAGYELRVPPLPPRSAFVVTLPARPRVKPAVIMQWRRYGSFCRSKALLYQGFAEMCWTVSR